jgi:hypothetical protein
MASRDDYVLPEDPPPGWEPSLEDLAATAPPRPRYRSRGILYLCRRCSRVVGFDYVSGGTRSTLGLDELQPCPVDGDLQRATDQEVTRAVAKTVRTGRPVRVRLSPIE